MPLGYDELRRRVKKALRFLDQKYGYGDGGFTLNSIVSQAYGVRTMEWVSPEDSTAVLQVLDDLVADGEAVELWRYNRREWAPTPSVWEGRE